MVISVTVSFIKRLVDVGVTEDSKDIANDIRLINILAISGAIIPLAFIFIMFFNGVEGFLVINSVTLIISLSSLLANYFHRYTVSKILICMLIPLIIVIYIYQFGNLGSENYMFVGAILSVYIFRDNKIIGSLFFWFSAVTFLMCKLIIWKLHGELIIKESLVVSNIVNYLFSFVLVYLVTSFFTKKMEREKKDLFEISENRARLISMLSHDMRNPVKNLELLVSESFSKSFSMEEYSRAMELMSEQLKVTSLTIENTILWVKNQLDGIRNERKKFNISKIVEKNILLMHDFIDRKEIKLVTKIPIDTWVTGVEEICNIVLRNLISNSIKYVYIESGFIEIDLLEEEERYWVSVSDNGRGIEEERLKMIFDQGSSQLGTSREKGFGMGLFIAKTFLENIGEIIEAESSSHGTMVRFSISKI